MVHINVSNPFARYLCTPALEGLISVAVCLFFYPSIHPVSYPSIQPAIPPSIHPIDGPAQNGLFQPPGTTQPNQFQLSTVNQAAIQSRNTTQHSSQVSISYEGKTLRQNATFFSELFKSTETISPHNNTYKNIINAVGPKSRPRVTNICSRDFYELPRGVFGWYTDFYWYYCHLQLGTRYRSCSAMALHICITYTYIYLQ